MRRFTRFIAVAAAAVALAGCGGADPAPPGNPCSLAQGRGWCEQHVGTRDVSYFDIQFANASRGLLGTSDGALRITDDGGRTWRVHPRPRVSQHFGGLEFVPGGPGYAVLDGKLHRSIDQGLTWQALPLAGVQGGVRWSHFADATRGWLMAWVCDDPGPASPGDTGGGLIMCHSTLYGTSDAGANWHALGDGEGQFAFADAFTGLRVDYRGVRRTVDGARTWTLVEAHPFGSRSMRMLRFSSPTQAWAIPMALDNRLYRSDDAGLTWRPVALPPGTPDLFDIGFADARNGWIVGAEGAVLRTRDGGESWQRQATTTDTDLSSVFALDAERVWIAGTRETILATSTGGD